MSASLLAAASAGASLLGGILNNRARRKEADRAWDREIAYNDPSAQMSRLKAAGLNPNLIYGNVANHTANYATPNVEDPTVKAMNALNVAKMVTDVSRTKAETDLVKGQVSKLVSDRALVDANTLRVLSENKKLGITTEKEARELENMKRNLIYESDVSGLQGLIGRIGSRVLDVAGTDKGFFGTLKDSVRSLFR